MALEIGGAGKSVYTTWWNEEERKRKEKLGIAGAPILTQAPAKTNKAGQQASTVQVADDRWMQSVRTPKQTALPATAPRDQFKRLADKARESVLKRAEKETDVYAAFWSTVQRFGGQEKFTKRLEDVEAIWAAHLKPHPKSLVWELAKSPYTVDQIESMAKYGGRAMFGVPNEGQELVLPGDWLRKRGYDPENATETKWGALEYALNPGLYHSDALAWIDKATEKFSAMADENRVLTNQREAAMWREGKQAGWIKPGESLRQAIKRVNSEPQELDSEALSKAAWGTLLMTPTGAIGSALSGVPKLAAALTAGVKMAKGFMVVGTALGEVTERVEAGRQSDLDRKTWNTKAAIEAASQPLPSDFANMLVAQQNKTYEQLNTIRASISSLRGDDAIQVQKNAQEMGLPGTKDLKADGVMTYEWMDAITDTFHEVYRETVDWQRASIEAGDADFWAEVDGDPNSDYWQMVGARQDARTAAESAAAQRDPGRYAFYSEAQLPMTRESREAYARRMLSEGYPQALYKAPLQLAIQAGAGWQAVSAAFDLWVRRKRDSGYQDAERKFVEYVNARSEGQPAVSNAGLLYGGKPEEYSLGYAVEQVENGELQNDATALQLYDGMKAQTARLISERYSSSYLLTAMHLIGKDYGSVEEWGREHPDEVSAFNVVSEIALAAANPLGRAGRVALRPTVAASTNAFLASRRATLAINRAARLMVQFDHGAATTTIGGSQAATLVRDVFRVTGKKVLRPAEDSLVMRRKVDSIFDAATKGDVDTVQAALNGNRAVAEAVVKQTRKTMAGLNEAEQVKGVGIAGADRLSKSAHLRQATQRQDTIKSVIGKTIAGKYHKNRDIISKQDIASALREESATRYARGSSIFPYLRESRISRSGRVRVPLEQALGGIRSNKTRMMLTLMAKPFYHAPLGEKEFVGPQSLDRIYDIALHSSIDAAWANNFRFRWSMAKEKGQYQALARELAAKADQVFDMDLDNQFGVKLVRKIGVGLRGKSTTGKPGFVAAADVEGSEALGTYKRKGELVEVVPDTQFEQYKLSMDKNVLWAPYRKVDGNVMVNAAIIGANATRRLAYAGHRVSQPMRRWTVAFGGALLWQKHALTDTSRTLLEYGPDPAIRGLRLPRMRSLLKRKTDDYLGEVSPQGRDYHATRRAESHASEVIWNSGYNNLTFTLQSIRDKSGKVRNLDESAHALRRIAGGRVFREWALGGEDGVRAYLASREGIKFLSRNGHLTRAKTIASDFGTKLTPSELRAKAIDEYVDTFVKQEFERLDGAMPNIMAEMKRAASGDVIVDVDVLKQLIRDNTGENAVVSMPDSVGKSTDPASYMIGKFMQMNKWNRDVVFDHVFNRTFSKLMKQGAEADEAVIAASDIASLEVSRIHFDLGNAAAVEIKHRWFAWFATKHRLYATYLAKLAVERPMLAAAALDVKDWMEQRNDDASEFDKFDWIFDVPSWVPGVGGTKAHINIGPYFWLSDYPLESSLGNVVERGAFRAVNALPGVPGDLHASPTPFGISTGRWDAMVWATANFINSPYAKELAGKGPGGDGYVMTKEDLEVYQDGLSPKLRDKQNRAIALKRAEASVNGETIDVLEAYRRAQLGSLWYEFKQMTKFASGRFDGKETTKVRKDLEHFFELSKTDPQAAYEFLGDNPHVGMMFNTSENAVVKEALDAGHKRIQEIREQAVLSAEALFDQYGGDIPDKAIADLIKDYENARAGILEPDGAEYNEEFANSYYATDQSDFDKAIGFLFPLVDVDSVLRSGKTKSDTEINEYKKSLQENFEAVIAEQGLTVSDSSAPLYKILKHEEYDRPLEKWLGYDPDDFISYREEKLSEFLARGGKTGPFKAERFLDLVEDRHRRDLLGGGLNDGRGVKSSPFLAFLTQSEKALIGWNSHPSVAKTWKQWAEAHWQVRKYQREHNINPSSKEGKRQWELFEGYSKALAADNTHWGAEWSFSRATMAERMRMLGAGSGGGKSARGWNDFLDVVDDYNSALNRAVVKKTGQVGVGPRSQTAGPITQAYLELVADLAKNNPEWWRQFLDSYTLSKFGFYWRRPDNVDDFLWRKEEAEPTDWYESSTPFAIWEDAEVK